MRMPAPDASILLQIATNLPESFPLVYRSLNGSSRRALRFVNRVLRSRCDSSAIAIDFSKKIPCHSLEGRFPLLKDLTINIAEDSSSIMDLVAINPALLSALSSLTLSMTDDPECHPDPTETLGALLQSCPSLTKLTISLGDGSDYDHDLEFSLPPGQPWWTDFQPFLSSFLEDLPAALLSTPGLSYLQSFRYDPNQEGTDYEDLVTSGFTACCQLQQLTRLYFHVPFADLGDLPLSDVSRLINLQDLTISSCESDIPPLYAALHLLTSLTHLEIIGGGDEELLFSIPSQWSSLLHLQHLSITGFLLSDLQLLHPLTNLVSLHLSGAIDCTLTFCHHLTNLTGLTILYRHDHDFSEVFPSPSFPAHTLHHLHLVNPPAAVVPHLTSFPHVQSLNIEVPWQQKEAPNFPCTMFTRLKLPELRELHLQKPEISASFLHWLSSLPHLTHLDLDSPSMSPSMTAAIQPPLPLQSLRKLTVKTGRGTGMELITASVQLPKLEGFDVRNRELTYAAMKPFLGLTQLLDQLQFPEDPTRAKSQGPDYILSGMDDMALLEMAREHPVWMNWLAVNAQGNEVTEDGFKQAVAAAGPHLQHLRLPHTNPVLQQVAAHCPNLKDLYVPRDITDDVLAAVGNNCSALTRLNLTSAPLVSSNVLAAALGGLQELRELKFTACDQLQLDVASCLGRLPHLKVLILFNCKNFDPECLKFLLSANPRSLLVVKLEYCACSFASCKQILAELQAEGLVQNFECWSNLYAHEVCRKGLAGRPYDADPSVVC